MLDAKTKTPLDATLKITDLKTNTVAFEDVSDLETGEFLATMQAGKTYALTVDIKGYLFYYENFSLDKPNAANKPYNLLVALKKIELGGMVVLNNIFFETNKFGLLPESKTELLYLIGFLKSNPTVCVEIDGHTDNVGDDKLNLILSQNRAKTVYEYLLANKISSDRLTFKGYGKTKPVGNNLTEDGKQANRRTEFKVTRL